MERSIPSIGKQDKRESSLDILESILNQVSSTPTG